MIAPAADPAEAYAPAAKPAGREASAPPPQWLSWLALLICCLREPWNAVRLYRCRRLTPWYHDRPDLPAGSAQQEAASVRGSFGTLIRWMCLRHGIGPGHKDWPELSRAIVAFGGSLKGFRPGRPAFGLQWWENPNIVPGLTPRVPAPAAATAALRQLQVVADAPPPALNATRADAAHARLPASWRAASVRQVFARAGPGPSTGPPDCPGLPTAIMFYARGQNMAGPAVLIRAA